MPRKFVFAGHIAVARALVQNRATLELQDEEGERRASPWGSKFRGSSVARVSRQTVSSVKHSHHHGLHGFCSLMNSGVMGSWRLGCTSSSTEATGASSASTVNAGTVLRNDLPGSRCSTSTDSRQPGPDVNRGSESTNGEKRSYRVLYVSIPMYLSYIYLI